MSPILPDLDLQPGELYLARDPAILRTILGSCIGVTFWSAQLGAGALCHGMLPHCPPCLPPNADPTEGHRYVDFSIRYLAGQFDLLGVRRAELVVKVFGGADVLGGAPRPGRPTVGALNRQAAEKALQEEGLIVSARDVGGTRGRRIHFHTGTGEVLLHRLTSPCQVRVP
jgi:chemotaxis protein CheD